MNQAHMSGQSSEEPNPAGKSLSAMPQQNGGCVPTQMQNSRAHLFSTDQDFIKVRRSIQTKIYEFFMHRNQNGELPEKKVLDIVRRLEEGLHKTAATKEEYLNLETLETRLHGLIKRLPIFGPNQKHQHANPSSSIDTVLPAPGMAQSGNSSLLASSYVDNSMIAGSGGHNTAHMSGQSSEQVTNPAGNSLSSMPQQNSGSVRMQMQNSRGHLFNIDQDFFKVRRSIQKKIYEFLTRRQKRCIPEKKVLDIVRRLEEGLHKTAATKEEYMNLETLETRLHRLIKRLPLTSHNQQYQHVKPSSSIDTMTPTPGLPQSRNSSLLVPSSMDNSMIAGSGGSNMMQNSVDHPLNVDQDFVRVRESIKGKIYEFLIHQKQSGELPHAKVMDIISRLEGGLYKTAATKEEYMNVETLEARLLVLIRQLPITNHNQTILEEASAPSSSTTTSKDLV